MTEEENLYCSFVESLALHPSETIFISSDISSVAKFFKEKGLSFDSNLFIEALQKKLIEGTIIIPAYTDGLRNGDIFDYYDSKPTTGALSNRIGRRKDFSRTFDPLHSVYVWGKKKTEIINLTDESTFGENSIFGFIARENAQFVFIDVDLQHSFTFIHYLEEKQKVWYRKYYQLQIQVKNKEIIAPKSVLFHTKKLGVSTDLFSLQRFLLSEQILKEKQECGARIFLSSADEMTDGVKNFLNNGGKLFRLDLKLYGKQMIKKVLGKRYF